MCCTSNLLDFYSYINCKELYLRYIYKLQELHIRCDNYTEAAYTLKLHADLLYWKPEPLPEYLKSLRHRSFNQHDLLKERLYDEIIQLFDKGKMWEKALQLCKELLIRHEEVTFDYQRLAQLHEQIARFYNQIITPNSQNIRPIPEYFRVAYWGRGFPAFLQNKIYIYRGNGYERLADFQSRILDQFPNAEFITKAPSDNAKESAEQYIQINNVKCIAKETRFQDSKLSEAIRNYYSANHVDTFVFSRTFHKEPRDPTNEFASLCVEKTTLKTQYELPGVLRCFSVSSQKVYVLSPIENAIEAMVSKNSELKDLIKRHIANPNLEMKSFTMKVHGIVDAAVQGGVAQYEKAFLTQEYMLKNPGDMEKINVLKIEISRQIPLLAMALQLNEERVSENMIEHHHHMKDSFNKIRLSVEEKYGVCPPSPDLEAEMKSRRINSQFSLERSLSTRLSNISIGSDFPTSPLSPSRISYPSKTSSTVPSRKSKFSDTGTLGKKNKREKPSIINILRRESFASNKEESSHTQWFDRDSQISLNTSQPPISEIASEPQSSPSSKSNSRPESINLFEMRKSRPSSISLSLSSRTPTPSIGSLESLVSNSTLPIEQQEEDDAPPPLPVKSRDLDPDRLSRCREMEMERLSQQRISSLSNCNNQQQIMRALSDISLPEEGAEPPEKPPKPPSLNHFNNKHENLSDI